MAELQNLDSERIFAKYIKNPENEFIENVERGGDTLKFKEKATGKVFIILVREEVKGTKIIVTARKTERAPKKLRPNFHKPI